MPQVKTAVWKHINKVLRMQHEETVSEPLPQRWIDLIRYLNEMDAKRDQATERKIHKN